MSGNGWQSLSLDRLRALAPDELSHYQSLFRAAGGTDPRSRIQGDRIALFLNGSGLPKDVLRRLWQVADAGAQGSLDLEGFCVLCRLCGHAQAAHGVDLDKASQLPVSEPPRALLHIEGFQDAPMGQPPLPPPMSSDGFDFEASAFGADGSGGVAASGMPSADALMNTPMPVRVTESKKDRDQGRLARGQYMHEPQSNPWEDQDAEAQRLDQVEGRLLQTVAALQEDFRTQPCDTAEGEYRPYLQEMIDGRKSLDDRCNEQSRLKRRVARARERLEACQAARLSTRAELGKREVEVRQHCASLEFSQQQLDFLHRRIAELRDERRSASEAEVRRAQRRAGGRDLALTEVREQSILASEVQRLHSEAERVGRRTSDLISRRQRALHGYDEAIRERESMQKLLQEEQEQLMRLQLQRLEIGELRLQNMREANRLLKLAGLSPSVLEDELQALRAADPHIPAPAATAPPATRGLGPAEDARLWTLGMHSAAQPKPAQQGWARFGDGGAAMRAADAAFEEVERYRVPVH